MPIPQDPRAFKPRNVAVTGRELAIAWGDGHESYLPFDALRRSCPCAACRARDAGPSPESASPESGLRVVTGPALGSVAIRDLVPVGAYALQIVWSDGHDTGIHSYESLRRACACGNCER